MKIERIVAGVDGSANSIVALEWAAGLASLSGAEVVAVHSLGLLERFGDELPVPSERHRDEICQQFKETWCAPLAAAGVRWRPVLHDGSPVWTLLEIAAEEHADVIVVGSRGFGGDTALLLGSTSTQVAQHASCPVVVVPLVEDAGADAPA